MNVLDFEILKCIYLNKIFNQREISRVTGFSLGKVNKSINLLKNENYLDNSLQITERCKNLINELKPTSAIILAAGCGLRMVPLCRDNPKGLLEVRKELLIERLINQLHKVGIKDIYIVVGYMKEKFDYLVDKYGVTLVVNSSYAEKNNLHSLSLAIDKIDNTYIIPSDIWCKENPFSSVELCSWYMVTNEIQESSRVKVNKNFDLMLTKDTEFGNKEIGIAYIGYDKADELKNNIERLKKKDSFNLMFWEEAIYKNKGCLLYPKIVNENSVFEINTYEDLLRYDVNSKSLESEYIDIICDSLNIQKKDIKSVASLKAGMTNRSFVFQCTDKQYIFRIPGEGTENLIDRECEYSVYQTIKDKNICDNIIYINPSNGYKITELIPNSRNCDPECISEVKLCMKRLKEFHQMSLSVNHTFDIFDQMEYYEELRNGVSAYPDYLETKEKVFALKEYIDKQEKNFCLTHIDAVPDNFILTEDGVYLIDWEYAAMQDPHVDIAMFAIYSLYNKKQVDELIDIYFENNCSKADRLKIYCYISTCGLLWSNWCEYKAKLGVSFGEYSLRQYRYAKDYYNIFMEEFNNE